MKTTHLYQELSVMKFIRNGRRARSEKKTLIKPKMEKKPATKNHTPKSRAELAGTFL